MANRRLQLRRLAAVLEEGRELPAAVHGRLLQAVRAELDGEGSFDDHLVPGMGPSDKAARNRHIIRAREALGGAGHKRLAKEAAKIETRIVAGELDLERPARWPAIREHEQHLARALLRGPMISRTQFYDIQKESGPEPDRTACNDPHELQEAIDSWKRTQSR